MRAPHRQQLGGFEIVETAGKLLHLLHICGFIISLLPTGAK
jgi:hypothetical protein